MVAMHEYLMLYTYTAEDGREMEDVMPIRAYTEPQAKEIARLLCRQNGYQMLTLELTVANAV